MNGCKFLKEREHSNVHDDGRDDQRAFCREKNCNTLIIRPFMLDDGTKHKQNRLSDHFQNHQKHQDDQDSKPLKAVGI